LQLPLFAFGQAVHISGKVTDRVGQALPGANVLIKGTTQGTITNQDGQFELDANAGDIVTVSFLGYQSQELPLSADQPFLDIVLSEDALWLGEVVMTGALGIERSARELGAGARVVSNENVN